MAETLDTISQIAILVFGAASILLISLKSPKKNLWGWIFGLAHEPFWFYTTFHNEQWGIFLLAIWYTYAWGNGLRNAYKKLKD